MPQRNMASGIGASSAISRECALRELGITKPSPSKEEIQHAYKRMAMRWYREHPGALLHPAGMPTSQTKSPAAPPADTLTFCAHVSPHRHPDKNLGEDTTAQMQHINNAYHRLLPENGMAGKVGFVT